MRMLFGLAVACGLLVGNAAIAAEPLAATPVVEVKALTLDDICCYGALGKLCAGEHRITVIHPYTCCPVDVCFCLPCDCYCVKCGKGLCCDKVRFDIPGLFNDVVIKFCKNGCVKVND